MKTEHLIFGAAALIVLQAWQNKQRLEASKNQITESVPRDTDIYGTSWDQLNGDTFWRSDYQNLAGTTNAHPGKVGMAQIGVGESYAGLF